MRQILSIVRKELAGYFGSPLALIFLGAFLAVELFVFFNVETFFARNIADIRPLFQWMPVLLIFLLAALTMRQWSEEQRSGTLEILLTMPMRLVSLVLGKFIGVMGMILIALALTLPLPITVSLLGNLDWGPVFGGYLAAILMASAYAAIGLFVSSRTDNQIVALLSTVMLGGVFYLVGTRAVTDFFGSPVSDILWAIGTGSRFESIQRGVIDLRDLVYYLSLAAFFLTLNVLSLDSQRWSQKPVGAAQMYRQRVMLTSVLLLLNLAVMNVWLFPMEGLRLDLTAQKEYSLSPVTRELVSNLQEPLLIRAYISAKTHPLLAPLAPRVKDMLREYEIVSHGKIKAEVIDPLTNPEIEAEANQTYGIKPTAFRVSGRHEASVINSYFDILVRYGDQSVVLNFGDIIEVEQLPDRVDVRLRNLEYDLTRAIKKVVFGFKSIDAVLADSPNKVQLYLIETPSTLPQPLTNVENNIKKVAAELQAQSNNKLVFEVVDPRAPKSAFNEQKLAEQYGIQAVPASLFSADTFYLHLLLVNGDKSQVIYPNSDMSEAEVRTAIESALKRTASGFLKTIGLVTPAEVPTQNMFGQQQAPIATYRLIRQQLGREYNVRNIELDSGQVPADIDVLVLVAPQDMDDKKLFAVDQYLMRGGSVVIATNPYKLDLDMQGGLLLTPVKKGIQDLLKHYGIEIGKELVMDAQSDIFPASVVRQVGNTQIEEIQPLPYPYFLDIRPNGMDTKHPATSNLAAVTLNWASPITLDKAKTEGKEVSMLLRSSPQSWLDKIESNAVGVDIQPDFMKYPETGFKTPQADEKTESYIVGVSLTGVHESYFKGKPSPLQDTQKIGETQGPAEPGKEEEKKNTIVPVAEKSPADTRLLVFSSAEFLNDSVLELSARLVQERYRNNLQLMQNAVDWASEDLDLLSIRARGTYSRVLAPMSERSQTIVEVINYVVAIAALLGLYIIMYIRKQNEKPLNLLPKSQ